MRSGVSYAQPIESTPFFEGIPEGRKRKIMHLSQSPNRVIATASTGGPTLRRRDPFVHRAMGRVPCVLHLGRLGPAFATIPPLFSGLPCRPLTFADRKRESAD